MTNLKRVVLPISLCILVLVGMILSSCPNMYDHDLSFSKSENFVDYDYSSNEGAVTNTVMFSTSGQYDIQHVAVYYDEDYVSLTNQHTQYRMVDEVIKHLQKRSVSASQYTASEMLYMMDHFDPSQTALYFASGTFPDILYDGTSNCPLLTWLDRGGTLVNVSGCLGKYVSTGPEESDLIEVQSYGQLFANVDDHEFNDLESRAYVTDYCNEDIQNSLNFYMNEVTYGINTTHMSNYLSIGYSSLDGVSSAVIFKSRNGMVMNFGASLTDHVHFDFFIAQIIASGIDYKSELIEHQVGDTREDRSGSFAIPDTPFTLYGYVGLPHTVYGERINSNSFDARTSFVQDDISCKGCNRVQQSIEYDEEVHDVEYCEYDAQKFHICEYQRIQVHHHLEKSLVFKP